MRCNRFDMNKKSVFAMMCVSDGPALSYAL